MRFRVLARDLTGDLADLDTYLAEQFGQLGHLALDLVDAICERIEFAPGKTFLFSINYPSPEVVEVPPLDSAALDPGFAGFDAFAVCAVESASPCIASRSSLEPVALR